MSCVTLCALLAACAPGPFAKSSTQVLIPEVADDALAWHAPAYADALYGLRPLQDGPPSSSPTLAITRVILRTNPKLAPTDALQLAGASVRAALERHLPPEFLAATLLQESAYDPRAISVAGAIGIAQFMPDTAAGEGIDPFDPYASIEGSADLLESYVVRYEAHFADPLIESLAAYNAGPGAVDAYRGVPPYAQTREYIADIIDRWAMIAAAEKPIGRR